MKLRENFTKLNKAELCFYRFAGVPVFKKLILLIEHLKHRRGGGYNKNYHPDNTRLSTLRIFSGYLLYNSLIHIAGIFLCGLYFLLSIVINIHCIPACIFVWVMVVFNLYCIMLQRYTYLRLKKLEASMEKRNKRRTEIRVSCLLWRLSDKSEEELREGYKILEKLSQNLAQHKDIVLTEAEASVISDVAEYYNPHNDYDVLCYTDEEMKDSPAILLHSLPSDSRVHSPVERRVSALQRFFGVPEDRNCIFRYSVRSDSPVSEKVCSCLFSDPTRDGAEFAVNVLLLTYKSALESRCGRI